MFGTTAASVVIGMLLAGAGETICHPIEELGARASTGRLEAVPSELAADGSLSRWRAAEGDTLRLRVRTVEPGTYGITVRVAPAAECPTLSAKLWDVPLTCDGEMQFTLPDAAPDRLVDVRFDSVPMGPGHHVLDLECLGAGEILLDCVGMRRTGDAPLDELGRPDGQPEQRAFLGVELGPAREDGVAVVRAIAGTTAERIGLGADDVILALDGAPTNTRKQLQEAIAAHRPGDRVEVELRRGDERIKLQGKLGPRPPDRELRRTRAEDVIGVLQARPGQVIADIGCGSGWLSEAIAEKIGPEGTIYAVEVQEQHVRRLRNWSSPNVVPVLSVLDDVSLPEACLDTAMLHDVASHIARDARPGFYRSLTQSLKPEGRLVIFGPHGHADDMLRELRGYGFVPVDEPALAELSPQERDERLREGITFRHE